jgi:hypothetical protein
MKELFLVHIYGGEYEDKWEMVEGGFLNKEEAIRCCDYIIDKFTIDRENMSVPYEVVDDAMCDLEEVFGYDDHDFNYCDYKGYTAEQWKESIETFNVLSNNDISFASVRKYTLCENLEDYLDNNNMNVPERIYEKFNNKEYEFEY